MSTPLGSSQWMYSSGEEVTQQSLKFNDDESQYLSWTPASAGNQKTWTWSGWVKLGSNIDAANRTISAVSNSSNFTRFTAPTSGVLAIYQKDSNSVTISVSSSQKMRDASAWYHVVCSVDTTQASSVDRVKFYINGIEDTTLSGTYPSLNANTYISGAYQHQLGYDSATNGYMDGYLADVHFIDGQALDASSFGQFTNGYWEKKDYSGTYGQNGFHLTFADDVVSEGFNTVTYTGNGSANGQSISGLGFSPDFVWVKERTTGQNHNLFDSVRGAGNNKGLISDNTSAEGTDSVNYGYISSFDGDGFTLAKGADATFGNARMNDTGAAYVGWCWDAGSGSPVSNTDGSITSTVKANPAYGFSIVTWTATTGTVGHGLGSAPQLIIEKRRSSTADWIVGTTVIDGSNDYLRLNTTVGKANSVGASPTATVFTPNTGSGDVVAYCFHSVAGYSSIGSYTGTGAAGHFIAGMGFKPAWLLVKDTTSTGNWFIYDNTRSVDGTYGDYLRANLPDAEGNFDAFVAVSSGFVTLGSALNASGNTYIYMAFADTREAAFWKDVSGQGNHWTPNNLDYRDSLIDSPANNFAVLNVLKKRGTVTYSEGNLQCLLAAASFTSAVGSFAVTEGKWYFEVRVAATTGNVMSIGVEQATTAESSISAFSSTAVSYYGANGNKYVSGTASAYGATYTSSDVIGVALDLDSATQTIEFFKNGTSQGSINLPSGSDWQPIISNGTGTGTQTVILNFGQDSTFAGARPAGGNQDANGIGDFAYAPPSGYLALCSQNLPTPTIVDGSEHFNTVLWTGNGSHIDVGFDPDLLWYKARNTTSYAGIVDSIRGDDVYLQSYSTSADVTYSGLLVTDSTGFTPGSVFSSNNYVAWNWKAGGTAVSNTDGSITSQVSANVDAGFSIVEWTYSASNNTVGHGLGAPVDMVITKDRGSGASNWVVWHKDLGDMATGYYLNLNNTNASSAYSTLWGQSSASSTTFGQGSGLAVSGSQIAYCFANSDIIKVGSYTGNGSSDGPFVYTGFRPAWVMIKSSTTAQSWEIRDDKREPFNDGLRNVIFADSSGAETVDAFPIDFTSNGFKLRNSGNGTNASGATFIYLAFAENPFKYANAR